MSRLPTLQGFRVLSQGPMPVLSKLTEQGSAAERNLHALLNKRLLDIFKHEDGKPEKKLRLFRF